MITRLLFGSMVVFSFLVFGSCKDDDGNGDPAYCSGLYTEHVQDEWEDVVAKATTFGQDPTLANCNAYKAAYQDWIDALEQFENCTGWTAQTKAQWQAALNDAREDLETLCDDIE